jgi:hypothetical protein
MVRATSICQTSKAMIATLTARRIATRTERFTR